LVNVNHVRKIRESQMMSKAELARQASVTVQTVDRIEKGNECRLDTKRKIILALGYKLGERAKIFSDGSRSQKSKPAVKSVKRKIGKS
jgi:DNA-binding XRE family transcriptional regulator